MQTAIKSFIFIFTISMTCMGQSSNVSNVATTSASFLEIGVGARAIAMGGAFVATANDASAMYWNPAGIAPLTDIETIFVHTNWLAGITYNYAGVIFPLYDNSAFGLNIISMSTDEMKVRTVDFPEGTGEYFDATSFALGLTYGIRLTDRFSMGINVKFISERIWKEKSTAFAVDLGTLYNTVIEGLRVGASLSNFGSDMKMTGEDLLVYHDIDESQTGNNDRIFARMETDSWPLPLLFQMGVAYDLLASDFHRLTVEADAIHPVNNKESVHSGLEYSIRNNYFIRAGYRNLFLPDSEEGLTFGGGFQIELDTQLRIIIDYAYADFGRLENAQRFTMGLKF